MGTQQTTEQPKRQLSSREAAVEAIANQNREQMNAEIKKAGGDEFIEMTNLETLGDPDTDPDEAKAAAARAALEAGQSLGGDDDEQQRLQQEQAQAASASAAEAARVAAETTQRAQQSAGIDPQGKYRLKVNGQEIEMSGEEVLRRAQKDTSADVRLEEANRVMREAQALQQSLQEQQRAQAEAEAARGAGGNPNGVAVDPAVAKKFTSALFSGDEEAATQAFNEAVSSAVKTAKVDASGRGNATPVDPSAIAAQVRQQIAIDSALERSRSDYPELYADPDIEAVAAARIQRAVAEGKPFVAALDEVQGEFAKKFGWKGAQRGTPTATRTDRREEKLARKDMLEQTPSGPAVKTSSTEEPQVSVHDAIREIAKARGQAAVS